MSFIIAGIHTGIGKTICSAVLTEALQYDYWKPIQAGDLQQSDSIFVKNHISNRNSQIHAEAYRLKIAASPHFAAEQEDIEITLDKIIIPPSERPLIIETAGGVMSPLSHTLLNIDLIQSLNLPVILVSRDYLGSINHTLLSIAALREKQIDVAGIVFSGAAVPATRNMILQYSGLPLLLSIPAFDPLTPEAVIQFAQQVSEPIKQTFDDLGRKR